MKIEPRGREDLLRNSTQIIYGRKLAVFEENLGACVVLCMKTMTCLTERNAVNYRINDNSYQLKASDLLFSCAECARVSFVKGDHNMSHAAHEKRQKERPGTGWCRACQRMRAAIVVAGASS